MKFPYVLYTGSGGSHVGGFPYMACQEPGPLLDFLFDEDGLWEADTTLEEAESQLREFDEVKVYLSCPNGKQLWTIKRERE